MEFREFNYHSIEEVIEETKTMHLDLHFSKNLDLLKNKVTIGDFTIPNSLTINPMEGCDGRADGSPDELTIRRYERFSRGGAGLLWFEAVAVVHNGRANPRQLWLHEENLSEFQKIYQLIIKNAQDEYGKNFKPICIMQLTHSGRYSKLDGKPAPIIASHNPYLDKAQNIDPDLKVIEDDELEKLEDKFVESAVLAQKAGFDGVDVKCCHRYLNSELLSSFTRSGKYGETFEGRTRFLVNVIDKIKDRLGDGFIVTSRMNIYDAMPFPYGWGVGEGDYSKYDLTEPIKLIKILYNKGVKLVNLTMGNPYYNPHVNRPYDKGPYIPIEHPLEGVSRMVNGIGEVQQAVPKMVVVSSGYSWLRHFSQYLAAGSLERGYATLAGFGREAFAYPDFAKDILSGTSMQKEKCCIACGKCSMIMRNGGKSGCVIRDSKIYAPIFNECCK